MALANISVDAFLAHSYDYVIAGGGTAGLVLANRLSADASVTVAVLEAGGDNTADPNVIVPGLGALQLQNPTYDWDFITVPQTNASNRRIGHPRGKQLGGTSALNLMYQTYASQTDLNDWVELGNEGWSWEEVFPYFLKQENFSVPTRQAEKALDINSTEFNSSLHGHGGPIQAGYPLSYGHFAEAWPRTFDKMGLPVDGDPKAGLALGGYNNPSTHNIFTAQRSYAGNGYWKPVSDRPNLSVMPGALVSRVIFGDFKDKNGDILATGVEFFVKGEKHVVNVTKEVLISGGTFGSPAILERSGIGGADLLKKAGIDVLIDNANVGENMQDHQASPFGFAAYDNETTNESLADQAFLQQALAEYQTNQTGPLAAGSFSSALLSSAQMLKLTSAMSAPMPFPASDQALLSDTDRAKFPGRAEQYTLTKRKALDPNEADAQVIAIPGGLNASAFDASASLFRLAEPKGHYWTIIGVVEHPFSRGDVHITSADPTTPPAIDPKYLSHPRDLELLEGIMLFIQEFAKTEPFASYLKDGGNQPQPGYEVLTKDNVEEHVKMYSGSEWHPVGTCAMEPRDKGGVVDPRLKVYGTGNVRVVDASIFPLQVRANIMSLVYAVAEKAADMIVVGEKAKPKDVTVQTS